MKHCVNTAAIFEQESAFLQARNLATSYFEASTLFFLAVSYIVSYVVDDNELTRYINIFGPVAFLVILVNGARICLRKNPLAYWTPLFWFRVSVGIFFGFGALFPYLAPDPIFGHTLQFDFDDRDLLYVNIINTVSTFVVLFSPHLLFMCFSNFAMFRKVSRPASSNYSGRGLTVLAMALMIVGLAVRYGLLLPYLFGYSNATLPGSVQQLYQLVYVGLFIGFIAGLRGNRHLLIVSSAVFAIEFIVSLATFAKSDVLTLMLMPIFASAYVARSKHVLVMGFGILIATYVLIKPLTDYGRVEIGLRAGNINQANIGERVDLISDYMEGKRSASASLPFAWYARLSYLNQQTFAVYLYDRGFSGWTTELIPYMFVPRILWPDKPIITEQGRLFSILISGNPENFNAPGIFAEAYWNSGWKGVLLWMLYVGVVFFVGSAYSLYHVKREKWIFLPIVLIILNLGLRPDAWFAAGYVGSVILSTWLHAAITGVSWGVRNFGRVPEEKQK